MLRQVSFAVNFTSTPYSPIGISGKACAGVFDSILKFSSSSKSFKISLTLSSNCFEDLNFSFCDSSVNFLQQISKIFSKISFVILNYPLKTFSTDFAICQLKTGGTAFPICLSVSRSPHGKIKLSGKDCNLAASRIEILLGKE